MLPKLLAAASVRPVMLSILDRGETYGYEIIQTLEELSDGDITWSDGTLYPVLHKLEADGLVTSTWRPSPEGRRRKYYTLTKQGQHELTREKRHWQQMNRMLARLWGPDAVFGHGLSPQVG